jgi:RimJ/RimL family protein N-acetyltransferase
MAEWENDPDIRELFLLFKNKEALERISTPKSVALNYAKSEDNPTEQCFMILLDKKPVGKISFFIDRYPIIFPKKSTAWVGIVIGSKFARGCGVGSAAMKQIEALAKESGAKRIELGVFEFNHAAKAFYEKLGYLEFKRLPEYTYSRGKMWADIRMVKEL